VRTSPPKRLVAKACPISCSSFITARHTYSHGRLFSASRPCDLSSSACRCSKAATQPSATTTSHTAAIQGPVSRRIKGRMRSSQAFGSTSGMRKNRNDIALPASSRRRVRRTRSTIASLSGWWRKYSRLDTCSCDSSWITASCPGARAGWVSRNAFQVSSTVRSGVRRLTKAHASGVRRKKRWV